MQLHSRRIHRYNTTNTNTHTHTQRLLSISSHLISSVRMFQHLLCFSSLFNCCLFIYYYCLRFLFLFLFCVLSILFDFLLPSLFVYLPGDTANLSSSSSSSSFVSPSSSSLLVGGSSTNTYSISLYLHINLNLFVSDSDLLEVFEGDGSLKGNRI